MTRQTSSTLIGGKGGAGPSSLHTTLEGPTEYVCECTMGVKSTWISSCKASNGSWFIVTWIVLENHLLKVGVSRNQVTMCEDC